MRNKNKTNKSILKRLKIVKKGEINDFYCKKAGRIHFRRHKSKNLKRTLKGYSRIRYKLNILLKNLI